MEFFFFLFSVLITLFNNVSGLPMFQNGEHKNSNVLFLDRNAKEQHRSFEEGIYLHHDKTVRKHETALKNKSIVNPTRLQDHYKKNYATKKRDHNAKNVLEIENLPAEGGFVHLTKTRSRKGRHYQAITKDQAEVLQDRKIPSNKH